MRSRRRRREPFESEPEIQSGLPAKIGPRPQKFNRCDHAHDIYNLKFYFRFTPPKKVSCALGRHS